MTLTDEEYNWIKTNVTKLNASRDRILKSPYYGTSESRFDRLLKRVETKEVLEDSMDRGDIKFLSKVIEPIIKGLESITIPEYQKRLPKDPKKYEKYLTKAQNTAKMLEDLVGRMKELL